MTCPAHVLMTVYNESAFLEYALRACMPHVQSITVVEGAYRETMALGASARSTDGTLAILQRLCSGVDKISVIHANERSDPHQRNVGLEHIKQTVLHGWLLIIDGDEVYSPITFKLINALSKKMEIGKHYAAYFKSLTFVNSPNSYTEQEFPRLFRLTPDCYFVNDNYMTWEECKTWQPPAIIKAPAIQFHHYSFLKGRERFALKKRWWETRFSQSFDYSWNIDDKGQITATDHKIKPFYGKHPPIMQRHPLLISPEPHAT